MSFLLDALRKSEGRKAAGRVPTIHDAEVAAQQTRPRAARPWLPFLVVALVAALGWRFFWVPREANLAVQGETGPRLQDAKSAVSEPSQAPVPPASPSPRAGIEAGSERTPVERFEESGQAVADGAVSVVEEPEAPDDATRPEAPATAGAGSAGPEEAHGAEVDGIDYRAPTMSEIGYWSLPRAVREEIPPPRITVLVFAERPADRFVLMNGRRLQEGDEASPGLVLEEIRREGALFSYRLYRFLVTQ